MNRQPDSPAQEWEDRPIIVFVRDEVDCVKEDVHHNVGDEVAAKARSPLCRNLVSQASLFG